jgi:hypothetical protein
MEATTAEKAAEEHSFLIRSSTNENAFILVKESEANRPVLVASLIKYVAEYTSLYSSAPSELAGTVRYYTHHSIDNWLDIIIKI